MATPKGQGKSERRTRKLGETQVAYGVVRELAEPPKVVTGIAVTRLSSKNQITVPVAYVRALHLRAGDELQLTVIGDSIVLARRPQTFDEWDARVGGSMAHVREWKTRESVDAWVRRERDSWERQEDQEPPAS